MATCNGAYATFDEKERGSLEVDPDMLKGIKVEELILSGKPYESAVTPLGKCIWRGLFSRNRY